VPSEAPEATTRRPTAPARSRRAIGRTARSCGLLAVAAVLAGCASLVRFAGPAVAPGALWRAECTEPVVALTIDDGPAPASTPRLLNVLRQHEAHATFFLIGERAAAHGDLVDGIVAGGHEIGNHTWAEEATVRLSADETRASIRETHELLSRYADIVWLRPGSARYDDEVLAVASELGYRLALGDTFPYDTVVSATAFHEWYVLHGVRPGSIIVLHNEHGRGARAAETLWHVLPRLRERGYQIVTLSELVSHPACRAVPPPTLAEG
jgi:peptidoglycan/xylan/chitin deacetylase (PgdA/CDA1 family)